jgi:predicted Fe-S protein YdhL (DUF1289 family)|tara:strand:+ start:1385 stop:1642 length:258 start_codon:yes stop_codon:yes gene_type:complete
MIVSPCISICKTDPISGYCYGCARNSEEKIKWKDKNTDEEWKLENLKEIRSRMKGWQLQSFEESYKFKCENGISIEKKRKILSNV